MALTNHERVGKAMDLLRQGLGPFVERELDAQNKGHALQEALKYSADDRLLAGKAIPDWDVAALLKLMWDAWHPVFKYTPGPAERSLVSELREAATAGPTRRPSPATTPTGSWTLRPAFSWPSRPRNPRGREAQDGAPPAPLRRAGPPGAQEDIRYRHRDPGHRAPSRPGGRWSRPTRTWPADATSRRSSPRTSGRSTWGRVPTSTVTRRSSSGAPSSPRAWGGCWMGAVRRLSSQGGDPVVQLQTNFGGGKTHSMLALYHLFSGISPTELAGVETLLAKADLDAVPKARRVVLVGNKISPGNPVTKEDGTVVRTLWGELAWQLGGKEAFARIARDDERATNPGDALRELFNDLRPLPDPHRRMGGLRPAAPRPGRPSRRRLRDPVHLCPGPDGGGPGCQNCLLVISLPASDTAVSPHSQADDVEVGGSAGTGGPGPAAERDRSGGVLLAARQRRGRLRDRAAAAVRAPGDIRAVQAAGRGGAGVRRALSHPAPGVPPECRDGDYEKRLKAAYPIHPEIFDRLYTDWSTLVKFQRTRGVAPHGRGDPQPLGEGGPEPPDPPLMIPIDDPGCSSS
jgi:hypothetical protein